MLDYLLIPINIIQFACIAVWSLTALILAAIARLITFSERGFSFIAKYFWGYGVLFFFGVRLKSHHTDRIPEDGNFIYVSNHQSFVDIPAYMVASPKFLYFIAKKELKKLPIIGQGVTLGGMFFIDRSDKKKAMQTMREAGEKANAKKKNILTFAEGSRTKTGEVNMFKRGTFILARETNLNLMPCAVKGARNVWPAERVILKPGKVDIVFGNPILIKDHEDKTIEEFAEFVRQEVAALQASIQ